MPIEIKEIAVLKDGPQTHNVTWRYITTLLIEDFRIL